MNKIETIKKLYSSAVFGKWDEFEEYIHEDFSIKESDALPYAGRYKGAEEFRNLVRTVFTYFE